MKKALFLSLIALSIISGFNCKKEIEDCDSKSASGDLAQEMVEYFGCFKEGSWWAYKDTVDGTLDTFRVAQYYRGRIIYVMGDLKRKTKCSSNESCEIMTLNSNAANGHKYAVDVKKTDSGNYSRFYLVNNGNGIGRSNFIGFINGKFYEEGANEISPIDFLYVQNERYENVLSESSGYYSGYYAPKVGLIKYVEYYSSGHIRENYELIDYHINY